MRPIFSDGLIWKAMSRRISCDPNDFEMPLNCTSTCLVGVPAKCVQRGRRAKRKRAASEERRNTNYSLAGGPDAEKMNYAAFFVAEILLGSFRISIALLSCRSSSLLG